MKLWRMRLTPFVCIFVSLLVLNATVAAQSSSTNYKVNEYFFGSGGELEACSGSYCSKQAAGEMTVGATESANYLAQGGFNTADEPYLEVSVNGNVDFGTLSQTSTKTGTATIQVRTYLASGYVMRLTGAPLQYTTGGNTYVIASPATPTASTIGTEQFGINLRSNTNPATFGADPVQKPDTSFSFGQPYADYNTPNFYMYQDKAPVAFSDRSSGQTEYTVSMIANISDTTVAGRYTGRVSVVVTSTF